MSLPDKSTGDYIANLSKTWHSQTGYLTEKEKPVTELYETLTDFKAEREKKYRREYGASEAKALYFYVFGEDKKDD
ncbi:hypothetical protein MAR_015923 [Mya arenaria]|uniref:Uncharacterized protein n=1 Tax=Mya arenaria TaxID=6604 RepID=A0ABY7FM62_MYAAR|nr:hypothetical protein MAR_015923 [Mya arenaria]